MLSSNQYKLLKYLYHQKFLSGNIASLVEHFIPDRYRKYYVEFHPLEIFPDQFLTENLIASGYIVNSADDAWKLTPIGEAYVEEQRTSQRRQWLPFCITTVIAIAAFVKSFFF